jgi:hypothetical protein
MNKILTLLIGMFFISFASAAINVTLLSPSDGLNDYGSNPVTLGTFINSTVGILNISIWSNITGIWEISNSTILGGINNPSITLTTDTGWSSGTNGQYIEGNTFRANDNFYIKNIQKTSSSDASRVYIFNRNTSTIISNTSFVGDNSTLDANITINTYFDILLGSEGLSYTNKYKTATHPLGSTQYFSSTGRVFRNISNLASFGGDTQQANIISITTQNITAPSNTTGYLYHSFNWTNDIYWTAQSCDTSGTCEFATQNRTLSYKVFENSRTYNTTAYETAYENYKINVTANSSLTGVNILFNGTSYPMTNNGSGVWSYSRDLPSTSFGNNSINFTFTHGSQSISPNFLTYQDVQSTIFTLCNGTYTNKFINMTFQDESTLGRINASLPLAEFEYYLGTGTETKTYQYISTTDTPEYDFCVSPNRTIYVDPYVQYSSSGYPQRIWNPSVTSYSHLLTSQILYLLSSANGIYVTFQVMTQIGDAISGVFITADREISGSDVRVASGTTDSAGSVTFWLNPDFTHIFNFSKAGYDDYTTLFAPTQTGYTVVLGEPSRILDNYYQGVSWNTYPTNSTLFNGTSYDFQFNLTSTYYDVDEYGFVLRLSNGTTIEGDSTGTEGTLLSKTFNVGNLSYIYMDYYWEINGSYINRTQRWLVFNTENTQWSISHFFTRLNSYLAVGFFGIDNFGRYLITFLILFMTAGVLSYKYGLTSPIQVSFIIFAVVFFFDVTLSFIPDIILPSGVTIQNVLTFLTGLIFIVFIMKEVSK